MNILEKIVAQKRIDVAAQKEKVSIADLEKLPFFEREVYSVSKSIKEAKWGLITEFKRKSPSKAVINKDVTVPFVVKGYETAGAAAISVLTDTPFFGGSLEDLKTARASVNIPLLRKEFIVDEYQIVEAKASGADFILLIAAALTPQEIKSYSAFAKSLGLEVLMEVHTEEELMMNLIPTIDLIGVNNRNLKTMEVNINFSKELVTKIPKDYLKISESGISLSSSVKELKALGFDGFLIGENFMKTIHPGEALTNFIKELNDGN